MKKGVSCAFNMDSGCVELKFNDGSMISIHCTAVENEVADNMYQRSPSINCWTNLRLEKCYDNQMYNDEVNK